MSIYFVLSTRDRVNMTFISKREGESEQYPVLVGAVRRFRYNVISMDTDNRTSDSWFSAVR